MQYFKMAEVSSLLSLAKRHAIRIPHWYHVQKLALIRDELKKRRMVARRTLDDIERAEKAIADEIINTRRKRLPLGN